MIGTRTTVVAMWRLAALLIACQIQLGSPVAFGAAESEASKEPKKEQASEWPDQAPDQFKVKFECSNGDFVMEVHKDWAPIGVQHFYDLVKAGFYDGARFFRVLPGFVVQFGISGDPQMTAKWGKETIKDEPVKEKNLPGTITYAKSGLPNSRTTQLFINLGDNRRLDADGFAPFAKVIEGMDVVQKFNAKYGEGASQAQGLIQERGNDYLDKQFPGLDYIKKATLMK